MPQTAQKRIWWYFGDNDTKQNENKDEQKQKKEITDVLAEISEKVMISQD